MISGFLYRSFGVLVSLGHRLLEINHQRPLYALDLISPHELLPCLWIAEILAVRAG